ncbi:MAG TPA: acyl-CoA desaturase [Polyangiaceae bacterium]|nr:acyl-CoA desaturase [Polyangiaceae bacterium]
MTFVQRIVSAPLPPRRPAQRLREFQWLGALPFILTHFVPLAAIWTGTKWQDWAVCAALYFIRMFGVTGAYHRYFSHRTYKTSRFFQFCLAFLAQTSVQKGALWWAAHHRTHHKFSDQDGDPHDARRGFWYSHCGWLFDRTEATDYSKVRDLAKYPELVLLNVMPHLPPAVLGVAVWWLFGWSGFLIGFVLSTVLLWHGTFTINSLTHMIGRRRYPTTDNSRNHLGLALLTLGEGWHNNHHHYMGSTRQGFFWWEIDITYMILKALSWVGLVWDLKEPPARVYDPKSMLPATPEQEPAPKARVPATVSAAAPPATATVAPPAGS